MSHNLDIAGFSTVNGICMRLQLAHNVWQHLTSLFPFTILALSTGCVTAARPQSSLSDRRRLGQDPGSPGARSGPVSLILVHVSQGTPKCFPQMSPASSQPRSTRATHGRVRSQSAPQAMSHSMTRAPSLRKAAASTPSPEKTSTKTGGAKKRRRRGPSSLLSASRGERPAVRGPAGPRAAPRAPAFAAARSRGLASGSARPTRRSASGRGA